MDTAFESCVAEGGSGMRGQRKIKQSSHTPGGRPLRGPVVFFAVVILMSASVLMLVARRPSGKALVIGTMEHQPTDQKAGISAVATLTFFQIGRASCRERV